MRKRRPSVYASTIYPALKESAMPKDQSVPTAQANRRGGGEEGNGGVPNRGRIPYI